MAKCIGIDLGTTNSVAAVKRVAVEVLENSEGELLTPSCVIQKTKTSFFKQKTVFEVGKNASEWLKQDPENTVVSIKRLLGRNIADKEVQKIISENKVQYKIKKHSSGTSNSLAVILGGKEFTPEEISSEIIKKIVTDSKKSLGDDVRYAVITVPSYFNDKQKHATRVAASLAGIKVQRLLPEPTAAAISYGVDNISQDESKTVIVFDFGGGTFDLSVLTISGGQFIEQGKGGDMWLGGDDIDDLIVQYALKSIADKNDIKDISMLLENQPDGGRNRFLGELKAEAGKAKILLSSREEAYIEVLGLLKDDDNNAIDVDVELSRENFNKLISPVVERGISLTKKILDDMNFTSDLIDNVLLVGGSSLIPLVRERVTETFGADKVIVHDEPMLANAMGAAILSHRLAKVYECPKCGTEVAQEASTCEKCDFDLKKHVTDSGVFDIVHSAAHDYFIILENSEKHLLIEKNSPLPIEKKETFKLVHEDQKLVHLKFVNIVNDQEESVGDLWLGFNLDKDDTENEDEDEDSSLPESEPLTLELTVNIDENNLIEVRANLKEHPEVAISKTLSRGKADEKLFLSLEKAIETANEKKYSQYVTLDLLDRSLSIIEDIHKVVNPETDTIDENQYKLAEQNIEKAKRLAEEDSTSTPLIYYAKDMLDTFGTLIFPPKKEAILKSVEKLREADKTGTYEETLSAQDDLDDACNQVGIINNLMYIKRAADTCFNTDPAKAAKFKYALDTIIESMINNNPEKLKKTMDDIYPLAEEVVDGDDVTTGHIVKDIKRR